MLKSILTSFIATLCTVACAQQTAPVHKTTSQLIPFLTKANNYTYVDSQLNLGIKDTFAFAAPFSKTGFALVGNTKQESAIINTKGDIVESYTGSLLNMTEVNGLTLLIKETSYEKKLPIWKWDWNIMGSQIKKTAPYVHIEVRILETDQVLFDQKMADSENDNNFRTYPVDDNHFVWNGNLYQLENNRFKKIKKHIDEVLDKGRYIPASKERFDIWEAKNNQAVLTELVGRTTLTVKINGQNTLLDSINQERFAPQIPKILYHTKTDRAFIYPQYDKAFPKEIRVHDKAQESFLNETTLIYSVNNSPYFILGKFNYDHAIWAFDWQYLDEKGNFHKQIPVQNFFITDQVGYTIWPDQSMIIPSDHIEENWKCHKIKYVQETDDLFIIVLQHQNEKLEKKGLWNRKTQNWEIQPIYTDIAVLDQKLHLYTLQQEKDSVYILYNNKMKQQIGQQTYTRIYANGIVRKEIDAQTDVYYYIDLQTGKEYREY